jgi:threonylcarbamoyladenosine tRNA methylthiotransferase MtaB
VLTGIFLGAYGRPTAIRRRFSSGSSPLAALVDAVARVEGLARLRLSSLEPGDLDEALLEVLARHACCVPHLHLPLQSGSAEILRRMNRQYTVEAFEAMIERVGQYLDRPAITTDVIVGFPGESDARFRETMDLARASGFCKIHAFPYSPRPHTAAARWHLEAVRPSTVKQRMNELRALEAELAPAFQQSFIGDTVRVLVEGDAAANGGRSGLEGSLAHGRSDRYFEVYFDGSDHRPGDLVQVRIDRVTPGRVHGVACGGRSVAVRSPGGRSVGRDRTSRRIPDIAGAEVR